MNAAEDRLAELMQAATHALHPPLEAMLAEGERLGRARRRRRRNAVAAGTATVVLLAGTCAAVGLRLNRGSHPSVAVAAGALPHTPRAPAAADRASPTPVASALPATVATPPSYPTPTSGALVPINSTAAINILKMSVPGAAYWKFGTYKPADLGSALLSVDVDDGRGLARIVVDITAGHQPGIDPIDCTRQAPVLQDAGPRPSGAPPTSCDVRRYDNGDLVMQEVLRADVYGDYQYRIITNRADGIDLEITAANGDATEPAAELTRAQPPLTIDQWTAIAMDRLWQLKVPASLAK